MHKIIIALSLIGLGGCAGLSFPTPDELALDARIAQRVSCWVAAEGGFGSTLVQKADAFACQLAGGTVAVR